MTLSRRDFVKKLGIAAGAAAAAGLIDGPFWSVDPVVGATRVADDFMALTKVALAQARRLGCSYADVLIIRRTSSASPPRPPNPSAGMTSTRVDHGSTVIESESCRVRVLHSGIWGFAASPIVERDEVARITERAVAIARANARRGKDRFDALLLRPRNAAETRPNGVTNVDAGLAFRAEEAYSASTKGHYSRDIRVLSSRHVGGGRTLVPAEASRGGRRRQAVVHRP